MADRLIYQGRKFAVMARGVVDRDGREREYDVITHPGAAVIVPVLPDGRILMIANHRVSVGETLLELPAGTIDPPEAPQTCAERELTEETGYRAAKLRPLVSFFSSPGICTERMYAFLATGLTAGATAMEPGERIEPKPMTLPAVMQAIRSGRITDAKSLVALLYYHLFVGGAASGQSTGGKAARGAALKKAGAARRAQPGRAAKPKAAAVTAKTARRSTKARKRGSR